MSHDFYAPRFDVRIDGLTMAADISNQVLSVNYDGSLDTADMFNIVLRNHNNQFTDFPLFSPGKEVELRMGYGDNLQPMMLGEIASIQPQFPPSGTPTIAISGYDKSYRLRQNQPPPRDFKYMSDSMMVAQIALENRLRPIVHPSPWFRVQRTQSSSDFAFIKDLASENSFDAYVYWDELHFQLPVQTEAYALEWGKTLMSFSPRFSTAAMAGLQVIRGYNEALAQAVIGVAAGALIDLDAVVEKLGPSTIEMLAELGRRQIHRQEVQSPIDALNLAKALLQDLLGGMYEGSGRCIGIPQLRAGKFIKVAGVGKRFGGTYRLRKVAHTIDGGGYSTEFEFGQSGGTTLLSLIRKKTDVATTLPPDRAPTFYGVAVAEVTQAPQISLDPDPAGKLGARVKVKLPWLSDDHESRWARVLMPSASNGCGMYFMPDVGDTVIVAFQDGNLSLPVVLGSVWDGPSQPPIYPPSSQNSVRIIKSKAGHTFTLDDTPGQETITIRHMTDSKVVLEANGDIDLTSKGNIKLTSNGKIKLTAQNIDVEVTGVMDVSNPS
jgi:phage protein D/phage baseplate assembly protein gpV